MIRLDRAGKSFDGGNTWAVREVSLDVTEGELIVLLGESGCGKTTTLKMINRLIDPTRGSILVDGEDIRAADPVLLRRRIGYVFQNVGLFPHLTVAENVAVIPDLLRWDRKATERRVNELLALVGLSSADYGGRLPRQLSGGQRQRVGLARALAARPRIMLMDEPFGALDPLTRNALQREFRAIQRSLGLTTMMVTHDMTEALLLADRIAVMAEGHVVRLDTPRELLIDPRHDYVARLMATPREQADRVEALLHKAGVSGGPSCEGTR